MAYLNIVTNALNEIFPKVLSVMIGSKLEPSDFKDFETHCYWSQELLLATAEYEKILEIIRCDYGRDGRRKAKHYRHDFMFSLAENLNIVAYGEHTIGHTVNRLPTYRCALRGKRRRVSHCYCETDFDCVELLPSVATPMIDKLRSIGRKSDTVTEEHMKVLDEAQDRLRERLTTLRFLWTQYSDSCYVGVTAKVLKKLNKAIRHTTKPI